MGANVLARLSLDRSVHRRIARKRPRLPTRKRRGVDLRLQMTVMNKPVSDIDDEHSQGQHHHDHADGHDHHLAVTITQSH